MRTLCDNFIRKQAPQQNGEYGDFERSLLAQTGERLGD